jgi:sorting nexin-29
VGIHHLFVDFKAASDSINRQLYVAMKELGIAIKIIRMVKMTTAQVQSSVRIQTHLSDSFRTTDGLRQGDALACLLFNIALEKEIQDSGIQTRGTIFFKTTQLLAYADDRDIMSRTLGELKDTSTSLMESAQRMGLEIYQEKTM